MVNDAKLMKQILRERMPLAFHPCNVYFAFGGNRVVFSTFWGSAWFQSQICLQTLLVTTELDKPANSIARSHSITSKMALGN